MIRARRAAAVPLLAAALTVLAAAPAAAAGPVGDIVAVTTDQNPMVVTYSAADAEGKPVGFTPAGFKVTLRQGERTTPARVEVGAPGPGSTAGDAGSAGSAATVTTRAVIALDVSGSMDAQKTAAAKAAAEQFLASVPPNVEVGLVTFGDPADVAIQPTRNHGAVRERVAAIPAEPDESANTALYEAVIMAAELTRGADSRSVLLLTDGRNDDQAEPIFDDPQAVKDKLDDVNLTAVAVDQAGLSDLQRIKSDGDRVLLAGDELGNVLAREFRQQAEALGNFVPLRVTIPADFTGLDTVVVEAVTDKGVAIPPVESGATYRPPPTVAAPGRPVAPVPDARLTSVSTPVVIGAIVLLFLALAMLATTAVGAFNGGRGTQSEVVRRLSVYTFTGREPRRTAVAEQTTALGNSSFARTAVDVADRITRSRNIDRSLDARLDAAGLPLRAGEWVVLHAGSAVGGLVLFLLLSAGRVVGGLLGLLLGAAAPWLFLSLRRSRRETAFLRQLPDTLQLLAGSLKTGYSLPQAMDTVVREARPPISTEFNRALIEARLGVPPEDALDGIAGRTGSRDFSWIVMAIRIQRDVGGNLAELLGTVADTLRERERLRRQVSALSAEGRLSGIILAALPLLFTVYLMVVQPDYLNPMFTTPLGIMLLIVGGVLLAIGGFWMSRIVKVQV